MNPKNPTKKWNYCWFNSGYKYKKKTNLSKKKKKIYGRVGLYLNLIKGIEERKAAKQPREKNWD